MELFLLSASLRPGVQNLFSDGLLTDKNTGTGWMFS